MNEKINPAGKTLTPITAEWSYDEEDLCYICSNCECAALNNYRGLSVNSCFCPHCGAKMGNAHIPADEA